VGGREERAASSVASALPRPPQDADVVWVKRTRGEGHAQLTDLCQIRPALLRRLLRGLIDEDHPAYRGITIDEGALADLENTSLEGVVVEADEDLAPVAGNSPTSQSVPFSSYAGCHGSLLRACRSGCCTRSHD
jgi:hypothetical protein